MFSLPTVQWMRLSTVGAAILEDVPAGAGAVEFFSFLTSSMKGAAAAEGRRFFSNVNAEEEGANADFHVNPSGAAAMASCFTSFNGGAAEEASAGVNLPVGGPFTSHGVSGLVISDSEARGSVWRAVAARVEVRGQSTK
jgi:hypothetical protein